jgi:hypothetical protein
MLTTTVMRFCPIAVIGALLLVATGCGNGKNSGEQSAAVPRSETPATASASTGGGIAPDTSDMGPFVLGKINANPSINGTATLVEFRQKSVSTEALGEKLRSAVVEFEGVVTFSTDVSWSWQGPTKAGEPQKFEARAEYVDQGQGWQLVEPLGIYPL